MKSFILFAIFQIILIPDLIAQFNQTKKCTLFSQFDSRGNLEFEKADVTIYLTFKDIRMQGGGNIRIEDRDNGKIYEYQLLMAYKSEGVPNHYTKVDYYATKSGNMRDTIISIWFNDLIPEDPISMVSIVPYFESKRKMFRLI